MKLQSHLCNSICCVRMQRGSGNSTCFVNFFFTVFLKCQHTKLIYLIPLSVMLEEWFTGLGGKKAVRTKRRRWRLSSFPTLLVSSLLHHYRWIPLLASLQQLLLMRRLESRRNDLLSSVRHRFHRHLSSFHAIKSGYYSQHHHRTKVVAPAATTEGRL